MNQNSPAATKHGGADGLFGDDAVLAGALLLAENPRLHME